MDEAEQDSYHVCAFGRLFVLDPVMFIVKSLGPFEPVAPWKRRDIMINKMKIIMIEIIINHKNKSKMKIFG